MKLVFPYSGLAAFLLLGGCQAPEPFIVSTPQQIRAGAVSICYHPQATTQDEVMALAREACAETRRKPRLVAETRFYCRVNAPSQADFHCIGLKESNLRPDVRPSSP